MWSSEWLGKRDSFPPISSDSQTLMESLESVVSGKRDSFPPMSSESQTDTHGIFGMVGEALYLPTKSSDSQETLMESLEWLGKRDSFPPNPQTVSSQRHSWNLQNRLYQGSATSSHRCPQTVRDTHGIFGISCIREARQLPTDVLRQSETLMESSESAVSGKRDSFPLISSDSQVRDTHGIFGISCIREARQLPTDILRQSGRHSWNLRCIREALCMASHRYPKSQTHGHTQRERERGLTCIRNSPGVTVFSM